MATSFTSLQDITLRAYRPFREVPTNQDILPHQKADSPNSNPRYPDGTLMNPLQTVVRSGKPTRPAREAEEKAAYYWLLAHRTELRSAGVFVRPEFTKKGLVF